MIKTILKIVFAIISILTPIALIYFITNDLEPVASSIALALWAYQSYRFYVSAGSGQHGQTLNWLLNVLLLIPLFWELNLLNTVQFFSTLKYRITGEKVPLPKADSTKILNNINTIPEVVGEMRNIYAEVELVHGSITSISSSVKKCENSLTEIGLETDCFFKISLFEKRSKRLLKNLYFAYCGVDRGGYWSPTISISKKNDPLKNVYLSNFSDDIKQESGLYLSHIDNKESAPITNIRVCFKTSCEGLTVSVPLNETVKP